RAVSYLLDDPNDNAYAHPIDNLVVIVDLDRMEVIEVEDGEPLPIPKANGRYDQPTEMRPALKPLEIGQPDGASFTLDGQHLTWDKWDLRFDLHPIEGLVLHQVRYDGRSVLYRASIAEMVVPY